MQRMPLSWMFVSLISLGLVAACDSQPQPAAKASAGSADDGTSAKKKPTAKPTASNKPSGCDKTSLTDDEENYDDGEGFALQSTAAPSYNPEIKILLDQYCVPCHKPGNVKGSTQLDTYTLANGKGARSNIRIQAGTMPTAGALDATNKAKFQAWITGGMLENPKPTASPTASPSPSSSSSPTGTSSSSPITDDCSGSPTPSTSSSPSVDEYKDLMNPAKLTECKGQGLVFDRRGAGSCHEAKIMSGTCDDTTAATILGGGPAAEAVVTKNKSEGFEVDQCGDSSTKKHVFWVKKYKTDTTLMLDIRINSVLK